MVLVGCLKGFYRARVERAKRAFSSNRFNQAKCGMIQDTIVQTPWQGKYLQVKQEGIWEYVGRVGDMRAAAIIAIDDGHVLLVDQYRVPLGGRCIELPAGLVGDEDSSDTIETASKRELEEETGYRANRIEIIGEFRTSPGMVSESFTLVRAYDLERVGEGGGTEFEDIIVHRVLLKEVPSFINAKRAEGRAVDVKILPLLLTGALLG